MKHERNIDLKGQEMASTPITDLTTTAPVANNDSSAAIVLFDTAKFDTFYADLKADVDAVPVDLETDKGRKAIASISAKVRSEKAAIDRDRKRLTQEWRDMTAQVNGAWNTIKVQLDALAVEARKPLTEWEEAEAARVDWCNQVIADLKRDAVVTMDDTAQTVRERGKAAWDMILKPETFGNLYDDAVAAKDTAVVALKAALARLTQEEADKAELMRLRQAEDARLEREAAEKAAAEREAEERARQEAAAKAEAERIEEEKRLADEIREQAAEEARAAAKAEAEEKERRLQAEHEEALQAERDRAAEIERAAQAESDRVAKIEADRLAAEKAETAALAKREADQAHRTKVKTAAKQAIMSCGADEDTAKKIVVLIIAGEVPHVRMEF